MGKAASVLERMARSVAEDVELLDGPLDAMLTSVIGQGRPISACGDCPSGCASGCSSGSCFGGCMSGCSSGRKASCCKESCK